MHSNSPPKGRFVAVIRGVKALFCTIPKSGSTTWRQLLRRVEGLPKWKNAHSHQGMHYLHSVTKQEYERIMLDPTWLRVRAQPMVQKMLESIRLSSSLRRSVYRARYH